MGLRIKTGRLSDLVPFGRRADWSELNDRLAALGPGETITVTCPKDVSMRAFRSTILVSGNRIHGTGDWRVSTRTRGNDVHCFLAPRHEVI